MWRHFRKPKRLSIPVCWVKSLISDRRFMWRSCLKRAKAGVTVKKKLAAASSSARDRPAGGTNYLKPDLFEGVEIDLGGPQYTKQDVHFLEAVKNGTKVGS